MAMADALAAVSAGADVIHSSVNGFGYLCGGTTTEELALVLEAIYGIDTGINLKGLYNASKLVEKHANFRVQKNKPVVGDDAFSTEFAGMVENTPNLIQCLPFLPEAVGNRRKVVLGSWSDMAALEVHLKRLNKDLDQEKKTELLELVQGLAVRKKRLITDDELVRLINTLQD